MYRVDIWEGELHQTMREENTLETLSWAEASKYAQLMLDQGYLVNILVVPVKRHH